MRIILITIFLCLNIHVSAQPRFFSLSKNKKQSFYNKDMIDIVNSKLRLYTRGKEDSAFVQIEDAETSFIDAFIIIKRQKDTHLFYLFFYSHDKKYYVVYLNKDKTQPINIKGIYNRLCDTNFIKDDTTFFISHKSTCHFYFGINGQNKEISIWNTVLWKDDTGLFAYRESKKKLYDYFSSGDLVNNKIPSIVKSYKVVKY